MRIGASLFLVALGAILKWAVTGHVSGLDLDALGTILLVVGAIGLLLSVVLLSIRRRTDVIHQGRVAMATVAGWSGRARRERPTSSPVATTTQTCSTAQIRPVPRRGCVRRLSGGVGVCCAQFCSPACSLRR